MSWSIWLWFLTSVFSSYLPHLPSPSLPILPPLLLPLPPSPPSLPPSLPPLPPSPPSPSSSYTVSLHGGTIPCPSSSSSPSPPGALSPGACQVKTSGGCNASDPSCVHTLGVFQKSNNSLSLIDGEVRVVYGSGDMCHHASVARKSVSLGLVV